MEKIAEDCVRLLERLGRGADEEAISGSLLHAHGLLLMRCQPAQRAAACMRISQWLFSKAMVTLGECPCWDPVPPPTLSLLFYLVSQTIVFYMKAKAEGARANFRWRQLDDPEFCIRRVLPWALHESQSLGMPALHVRILRCIFDCFARTPNVNMYKSEFGAEAHLILAELIFKGQADVSVAAKTETSQVELVSDVECAAGSSNIKGVVDVDGSSKFKGVNASSHVKDVEPQRKKDTETKRASCVYFFRKKFLDSQPQDMKRASELVFAHFGNGQRVGAF